jgi:hypothetical protein
LEDSESYIPRGLTIVTCEEMPEALIHGFVICEQRLLHFFEGLESRGWSQDREGWVASFLDCLSSGMG